MGMPIREVNTSPSKKDLWSFIGLSSQRAPKEIDSVESRRREPGKKKVKFSKVS